MKNLIHNFCLSYTSPQRRDLDYYFWLLFYITVILFVVAIRIRLLGVPLERDEGEFAYIGQQLLQGIPPYMEAYSMKLPGIYGAYAAILKIFGSTKEGIHFGLLVINLASIIILTSIGKSLYNIKFGMIAGLSFALLSLSSSILGMYAHATHFVIVFSLYFQWKICSY